MFVYFFDFYGLLLYYLFNSVLTLTLTHRSRPFKVEPKFNKLYLFSLFRIGLPIFLIGYTNQFTKNIGKLIILLFGTTYLVGVFSPAMAIFVAFSFIPVTLSQYFFPKFSYLLGKYDDKKKLIPYLNNIYLFMVSMIVISIPISYFILPQLFEIYFSEYTEGLFAAQILLITSVLNIHSIAVNMFYSLGRNKKAGIIVISKLICIVLFTFIIINFVDLINAVSLAFVCSYLFAAILSYILLRRELKYNLTLVV